MPSSMKDTIRKVLHSPLSRPRNAEPPPDNRLTALSSQAVLAREHSDGFPPCRGNQLWRISISAKAVASSLFLLIASKLHGLVWRPEREHNSRTRASERARERERERECVCVCAPAQPTCSLATYGTGEADAFSSSLTVPCQRS